MTQKTLFLWDAKEQPTALYQPGRKFAVPYIFYDRSSRKWRQDTAYTECLERMTREFKANGYKIEKVKV